MVGVQVYIDYCQCTKCTPQSTLHMKREAPAQNSRKARSMLAALRRKLGRHVNREVMGTVYKACIRSVLDYGLCAYDPILKQDSENLGRAQLYDACLHSNNW